MSDVRKSFFPKQRRRVELDDYHALLNEQSEQRFRFDLLLHITGESLLGHPEFFGESYTEMEKENSPVKDIPFNVELEEMTLEFYATDSSEPMEMEWGVGLSEVEAESRERRRKMLLTGCTLRSFKLVRITRDSAVIVALQFSVTTKADIALALFLHKYHGKTFWTEFTAGDATQAEITENKQMPLKAQEVCPFPECKLYADHEGDHVLKTVGSKRTRKLQSVEVQ